MSVLVKATTDVKVGRAVKGGPTNNNIPDAGATGNWGNKAGGMKAKGELAGKFNIVGAKEEMKKPRRIRDPNAPKRPVNPFMSFSMENRVKVMMKLRQSGEGRGARGQVTKKLAQMWAEADMETRKKHMDIGNKNTILYKKEKQEYVRKEPDQWEVQELLEKREGPDGPEYMVRWKGFADKTWEPMKHLEGSKNLLKRFNGRDKKISKQMKHKYVKKFGKMVKKITPPKPSGPPGPPGFGH